MKKWFLVVGILILSQPAYAQRVRVLRFFFTDTFSQAALKTGNLNKIERAHCNVEAGTSSDGAKAGFGCCFVQMAKMFESPAMTDLLAALRPVAHVQFGL